MWDQISNMFLPWSVELYKFYLYMFWENTGDILNAVKNNFKPALVHNGYPHGDSSISLIIQLKVLDGVYYCFTLSAIQSFTRSGYAPAAVHFSGISECSTFIKFEGC